jgi:hypothetical protein
MNVITTKDITPEVEFYIKKTREIQVQIEKLQKIQRIYERKIVEQVNAQ